MNIKKIRRIRKKHVRFRKIYRDNIHALIIGIGMPFIAAAAFNVKNAAAISVEMFVVNMFSALIALTLLRKIEFKIKAPVMLMVSTILMMLARDIVTTLIPDVTNSMGIYIYLMALNGIILLEVIGDRKNTSRRFAFFSIFLSCLFLSLLMFLFGTVREIFGNATFWGIPIKKGIKIRGLLMPFSGLILMGFFMAAGRFITKKLADIRTMGEYSKNKIHNKKYNKIYIEPDWE